MGAKLYLPKRKHWVYRGRFW